jgi:hypothetical protein
MVEKNIPIIDTILHQWRAALADDYLAYSGHVYRIYNYSIELNKYDNLACENEIIAIAACFHDIGIWTDNTFDYLTPSVNRATEYLNCSIHKEHLAEISLMILNHHKLTAYRDNYKGIVENFRRADLIDLSLGIVKFRLSNNFIKQVRQEFPNNGFHMKLVKLSLKHFLKHPLNPFPMFTK